MLQTPGSILTPFNAGSPEVVREEVRRQKAQGADFVKIAFTSPEAFFAAIEEGRKIGIAVLGQGFVDAEAALYEQTMDVMARSGFEHYEVSSYARPGYRCLHNSAYWSHAGYLGFGPSAHSFWRLGNGEKHLRWANVSVLDRYCDSLLKGEPPVAMREEVTRAQLCNERIFLGLRSSGVNLRTLEGEFGLPEDRLALAGALVEDGAAVLEEGRLRLTARGYMLCDEIAARMMV